MCAWLKKGRCVVVWLLLIIDTEVMFKLIHDGARRRLRLFKKAYGFGHLEPCSHLGFPTPQGQNSKNNPFSSQIFCIRWKGQQRPPTTGAPSRCHDSEPLGVARNTWRT